MGNSKQALAVIINKLGDIEEAVEFVTMQHDDELWEELIKQCLHKPKMIHNYFIDGFCCRSKLSLIVTSIDKVNFLFTLVLT
ncbi:Vacuolar protein sorting-associated protein 41 like [Glycine soja]|uniref:Vacuolar protein sorting-associated protein 41 like n=1 Tax=Glycine soja TaxID=3848 RepID=A0A0B2SNS1_GLYSO|nr:Vacuolar protein sorting-associated protein 41 like [Glycine soja]